MEINKEDVRELKKQLSNINPKIILSSEEWCSGTFQLEEMISDLNFEDGDPDELDFDENYVENKPVYFGSFQIYSHYIISKEILIENINLYVNSNGDDNDEYDLSSFLYWVRDNPNLTSNYLSMKESCGVFIGEEKHVISSWYMEEQESIEFWLDFD